MIGRMMMHFYINLKIIKCRANQQTQAALSSGSRLVEDIFLKTASLEAIKKQERSSTYQERAMEEASILARYDQNSKHVCFPGEECNAIARIMRFSR